MSKPQTPSPKSKKPTANVEHEQQIGELTATLQRLQADFENYKKRAQSEREELMNMARVSVLTDLMPALDNFDRAAAHLPAELADNAWAQGMSYVGTQLTQILDEMGVQKFSPLGEHFDHHEHEAVEFVTSDKPEGTVIEVVSPGYKVADRVVRPAAVKVSSGRESKTNQSTKGENNE